MLGGLLVGLQQSVQVLLQHSINIKLLFLCVHFHINNLILSWTRRVITSEVMSLTKHVGKLECALLLSVVLARSRVVQITC